jgi:hypothetical protein
VISGLRPRRRHSESNIKLGAPFIHLRCCPDWRPDGFKLRLVLVGFEIIIHDEDSRSAGRKQNQNRERRKCRFHVPLSPLPHNEIDMLAPLGLHHKKSRQPMQLPQAHSTEKNLNVNAADEHAAEKKKAGQMMPGFRRKSKSIGDLRRHQCRTPLLEPNRAGRNQAYKPHCGEGTGFGDGNRLN